MSSINGVDKQPLFIPINQDPGSSNNGNGSKIDDIFSGLENKIPNFANSVPDFESIFQSLLARAASQGQLTQDPDGPNGAGKSVAPTPGNNDNNSLILSLLEQLQGAGSSSENAGETGVIQPIADPRSSQAISKYLLAMQNFKNASASSPVGMDGTDINSILNKILSGDSGVTRNIAGTVAPGVNPSKQEVINYIREQCRIIGLPEQLGLATAATESEMTQFNKDGSPLGNSNPGSTDWGIMQINDQAWGDTYDMNRIKSDWRYNVRAGLQILKANYDAAIKNNEGSKGENSPLENLVRAAYSGYNAGVGNLSRYRTPVDSAPHTDSYDVLNYEGFDLRDIRFWNNYRKST